MIICTDKESKLDESWASWHAPTARKDLRLHRLMHSFVKIGRGLVSFIFLISKAIKYGSDEKSIFPAAPGVSDAGHWLVACHMTKLGD